MSPSRWCPMKVVDGERCEGCPAWLPGRDVARAANVLRRRVLEGCEARIYQVSVEAVTPWYTREVRTLGFVMARRYQEALDIAADHTYFERRALVVAPLTDAVPA